MKYGEKKEVRTFMPNTRNISQLTQLQEKYAKAKSAFLTQYAGLTVKLQTTLRSDIKKAGGELIVAKNTLIDRTIGKDALKASLKGQTAIVLSYEDEVEPLKVLVKFAADTKVLEVKQGVVGGAVMSENQLKELSKLPGKPELIRELLARLNAPASKLVGVLTASQRNLVYALQAISEKKV